MHAEGLARLLPLPGQKTKFMVARRSVASIWPVPPKPRSWVVSSQREECRTGAPPTGAPASGVRHTYAVIPAPSALRTSAWPVGA
ncbi:hypothetical protein [Streptomyces sp. NPDC055085]